jgi:hypothetical protein
MVSFTVYGILILTLCKVKFKTFGFAGFTLILAYMKYFNYGVRRL